VQSVSLYNQQVLITQVNAILFTWLDDPCRQPDLLFCRGHVGHLMKYDDRCNKQQRTMNSLREQMTASLGAAAEAAKAELENIRAKAS